jgi:hypothetical protein
MPFAPNRKIQLQDITPVVSGAVATINCPKGPRFKSIQIIFGDAGAGNANAPALSAVTSGDIQILCASKQIRRATAVQIDAINQLNGSKYASIGYAGVGNGSGRTMLTIFFEEPWRKRADYQNGLALATDWLGTNDTFQIKIPMLGTTPVLAATACVDDFGVGAPNPIMKWQADDSQTSSAGVPLANIFQGMPGTDLISEVDIFDPSDSVAGSKGIIQANLLAGSQIIYDNITANENAQLLTNYDMNPQAGLFPLVFDHDDLFESLRQVSTVASTQLNLTLLAASAGTLRRITQRLGLPTLG